jgi:RNA polymerase sigma-70 factor, ECF subfamily
MQRTSMWCERPFEAWTPDESLLERTRDGDGQALGALASRYWSTVYCVAWNMLADVTAAAQVAEATFLAVLRSDEAFPKDVPFTTSLYRVALGESWRRLHADLEAPPKTVAAGRSRLPEALQRLDSLDRAAFILRELEQLSPAQAAAVLGIARASIRERTHRATLLLAGSLSGDSSRARLATKM